MDWSPQWECPACHEVNSTNLHNDLAGSIRNCTEVLTKCELCGEKIRLWACWVIEVTVAKEGECV